MNGDLISRNALIQHAYSAVVDGVEKDIIDLSDVDNAPTVYPICEDKACKYRANERPQVMCENCDLYFKAMTKEEMKKGGADNDR